MSVVMPAYNAAGFIDATLRSTLAQTHREIEVIVVDDGSTDATSARVAAISARDDRVRLVRRENRGPAAARNHGIAKVRGEFIAFQDADDPWLAGKLERQLALLEGHPDVVAVATQSRVMLSGGRPLGSCIGDDISSDEQQQRLRGGYGVPFMLSTLVCRAHVVRRVGQFDESLISLEDLDFVARLAQQGRIATIMEPLAEYILQPGSISTRIFRMRFRLARFIQARLAARARGGDLTWEEFDATFRLGFRDRWNERSNYWYRAAGIHMAQRHFGAGLGYLMLSGIASPLKAARRLGRIIRPAA